jgi:hypothetical protein
MDCTLVSETVLLKMKKQEQKERSPSKICLDFGYFDQMWNEMYSHIIVISAVTF